MSYQEKESRPPWWTLVVGIIFSILLMKACDDRHVGVMEGYAKEHQQIVERGKKAFYARILSKDNPYLSRADHAQDWRDGWIASKLESQREEL